MTDSQTTQVTVSSRPLRIGLTGGIGSGKSTVAAEFEKLGIPIIDADQVAREVVQPGQTALQQLAAQLGEQILYTNGTLNRPVLKTLIFNDPEKRKIVETILHPAIYTTMEKQAETFTYTIPCPPYLVFMIPLLVETAQPKQFDEILVIDLPEKLQIQRTMARDQISEIEVRKILASQASRKTRLQIADTVVDNTNHTVMQSVIQKLHQHYLELARNKTD